MRRYRGRTGRASFRGRRRRATQWLTGTDTKSGTDGIQVEQNTLVYYPLVTETNTFVQEAPRFAKALDVMTILRIVGRVRFGLYITTNTNLAPHGDYIINWGFCLIKGDYDDSGTWTREDEPDPRQGSDEDDKWLFKDQCVLCFGDKLTTPIIYESGGSYSLATINGQTGNEPLRMYDSKPVMMSNEQQLPNGSFVDIKSRRRAQYGEKLMLVASIATGEAEDQATVFLNYDVRVLTAKWN